MKTRCFSLVVLVTVTLFSTAVAAQDAADFIERIEGVQTPNRQGLDPFTLVEVMEKYGVPGVSVAVIHDFRIHWSRGYGIADVVTGAKVDTETMFQAASISKPVAAMAVLSAVQAGKFSLDVDINTILTSWHLPDSKFTAERPVTPRTLLSHTSGLGDGFGFPGYDPSDALPTTVQILDGDAPSNVGPVLMERAPLTGYKYSGGGVTLMQLALQDALGRPFPEILNDSVIVPIAMSRSAYEQPLSPERDQNAARAHDREGKSMDVTSQRRERGSTRRSLGT